MRLLLLFFFSFGICFTQSDKKTYFTKKIEDSLSPVIDGEISDQVWNQVEWSSDFIQFQPEENTQPSNQTKYKLLYDNNAVYIFVKSINNPNEIVNRLSRRDKLEGDAIMIGIDSNNDKISSFMFCLSSAGTQVDMFASGNGDKEDESWNAVWYSKTKIDEDGWNAELKIPFSQLRFSNDDNQTWGFNIMRIDFKKNETSLWDRVPVGSAGWISESGEIKGISKITPKLNYEIKPFSLVEYNSYENETGNPFRDGSDLKTNFGIDGKINITSDLTLDFTINPDFGQVEADPSVINLDGFEIFFDEKRPFFVEGKNIFDFNFGGQNDNLFFSRRIGKSPSGYPSLNNNEYSNQPLNTTILGAVKISGKTNNGWSIGLLESMTSDEFAKISDGQNTREELVEPQTNYIVARIQKDYNDSNSYVGGILTNTRRFNLDENLDFLHKNAFSTGIDFKHQWNNKDYFFDGKIIMSKVEGSKESITRTQNSIVHLFQRVDADHVSVDENRTSLTGTGGTFNIGKQAGGNWTYNVGFDWYSPELELNDIGYLKQADNKIQALNVSYRTLKPTKNFRSIEIGFEQFSTYDFEGNHNRTQYGLNSFLTFKNNFKIRSTAAHKPKIFINTYLRGGPRWRFSEENYFGSWLISDTRKKFTYTIGMLYSKAKENNFSFFTIDAEFGYRPFSNFSISISPQYRTNPNLSQYLTTKEFGDSSRYILGRIDNESISTSIRLNYLINPNLSIQYYGQPFIFKANYDQFKYVTNSTAKKLNDRFSEYNSQQILFENDRYYIDEDLDNNIDYSFGDPDFTSVQFKSNLVLRWEYKAGAELYFVWAQGINNFTDINNNLFGNLIENIKDSRPENTFLVKATFRIGS